MKILFYISTLGHGGAERVIVNLSNSFANDGYDVILVNSKQVENEYPVGDNIKRIILGDNSKGRIVRNISLVKALRAVLKTEKPDIAVSFMAEPSFRLLIAVSCLGIKTLISVRQRIWQCNT